MKPEERRAINEQRVFRQHRTPKVVEPSPEGTLPNVTFVAGRQPFKTPAAQAALPQGSAGRAMQV